jgi:GT2 family glycosyltransferase
MAHAEIEVVSATRFAESDFWKKSALGLSLSRLKVDKRIASWISFENRRGLPDVYNSRINADRGIQILVFLHDDVWIEDQFFSDRLIEGLKTYDVLGVAGNRRRTRFQPAWCFANPNLDWENAAYLSGAIGHGPYPFSEISFYGPSGVPCETLDGVFLAVLRSKLQKTRVRFDPLFAFHFYDVDFCRSARANALRLGTWPICLTHQSGGAFTSPPWMESYRTYLEKWGD